MSASLEPLCFPYHSIDPQLGVGTSGIFETQHEHPTNSDTPYIFVRKLLYFPPSSAHTPSSDTKFTPLVATHEHMPPEPNMQLSSR